ncbi:MAG: DMT family transporter [Actinobacteria bacterium]|nr:DMT family transporter [Actinomycetota bacterium]
MPSAARNGFSDVRIWLRSWAPAGSGRVRLGAEIALAMAGVIWGANFVLVKLALEHTSPLYFLGLRFLVGSLLLAPFSLSRLRRLGGREWLVALGVGVLLFFGFACQTLGLETISPGLSGFLTNLYVILVPLMLGVATGRWPSPLVGVGVLIVVGGLAILSVYGDLGFGWGEIWTLAGTFFWAVHILAVAYATSRISVIAFVHLQLTVVAVLSLAFAFIFERPALFPGWEATGAVLWTGVLGGPVAYVFMALGQRHTPPTLAGVLMSLESVFALLVSIIVGYDSLTLRTIAGFMLVFAGCTVARMGSEKAPAYIVEPAAPSP